MLVYHQAIYCSILTSYLIRKIQSRIAGVRTNELPKFLVEDMDENMQKIIVDDPLSPNEPLIIPLASKGVTIYFQYRKPKESEYGDVSILHIDMTGKATVWESSETSFSEQEDVMADFR